MDRYRGSASIVGRKRELAQLERMLEAAAPRSAIVIIGGPGIGKTTLWGAALGLARSGRMRVLDTRSSSSEARLPFAGMIDLCDGITPGELAGLPWPQRSALEAALLRTEPSDTPVQTTAIARALLGVVRALAARDRVLIAIDDLQWLDQPSAELVAFVARRLGEADVRFLLARRPGRADALEQVLMRQGLERLRLDGLSLGAVRRLLFERLELTLSRQLLRRIVEATEGNPLFALEVGRSLLEDGIPRVDDELPLPSTVEEMLGVRVAGLRGPARRLLLAIALSADPRVGQVGTVADAEAIEEALDAGLVVIEGDRIRASHPLMAAAAQKRARARERREVHLALARVAQEQHVRILHLALANTGPDPDLAARTAAAAEDARARGARRQAVLLAGHALRLTPSGAPERAERVLTLAERLDEAGELRRLTDLLLQEVSSLPSGAMRARAFLLLAEGAGVGTLDDHNRYLERALAECGDDHNLRAYLHAKIADNSAAAAVSELSQAEASALAALDEATEMGVKRFALYALAWVRVLTGRPVDDLCERSRVADDPSAYVSGSPERVAGKRLLWRGELERARDLFGSLSALADARGEPVSYAMVRLHLCELELRAGNLKSAESLLDEWAESSDYETQFRPQYQRCRALLAAGRGDAGQARRWAADALERATAAQIRWDELEARRARATAALLEREPGQAIEDLNWVWQHCQREGVLDPGTFPAAPDLVEALLALGETEQAQAVTARLDELSRWQDHPWAKATTKRCRALALLASDQRDEAGVELLEAAADDYGRLGLRFDAARCTLSLGRTRRRARQWRSARESLEAAATGFASLHADGWADLARAELARIGARHARADSTDLTPSERRVVELAAEGLANKQIASTLFVTVNTVEVHLAHAYAKLGVHSRGQLARALAARR